VLKRETSERNAHHPAKPNFNTHEHSEIHWNASAVTNGAAAANGSGAHGFDCGADDLRGDDGVGVNEDEQIALPRARPGVARRRNLAVMDGDNPGAMLTAQFRPSGRWSYRLPR